MPIDSSICQHLDDPMITPQSKQIKSVLKDYSPISVPNYQREFKWGKSEAIELIEDLKFYSDNPKESLFLGTIILSKDSDDKHSIVDGQQRITTISILLAACREQAKRLNHKDLANKIQEFLTAIDDASAKTLGPNIIVSDSIKEPYNELVSGNWDGNFSEKHKGKQVKRKVNRIKPVFDYFTETIKDFNQDQLSSFLRAIYNSYTISIVISDPMEAFNIFERTNGRGIDLEASDLLKNYFFSKQVSDIEEKWAEIVINSDATLLRMLKYYYVANNGYILKSKLYKEIKNLPELKNITDKELLDELLEFSIFYKTIKSGQKNEVKEYFEQVGLKKIINSEPIFDSIFESIEGLREFKVTQFYPLIFAAIDCFKRNSLHDSKGREHEKLAKIFTSLEKYHFANNAICDRVGNEVEKPYADICLKFRKDNIFSEGADMIFSLLKSQIVGKNEFVERFSELKYEPGSIGLITFIFDRLANQNHSTKVNFFTPGSFLKKHNSIEHFYPQKPQNPKDKPLLVDSIGNLLILASSENGKLSNKLPLEKIQMLNGELKELISNNPQAKAFVKNYKEITKWDDLDISKRAEDLGNEYYAKVVAPLFQ
jgi:hypothetical protein